MSEASYKAMVDGVEIGRYPSLKAAQEAADDARRDDGDFDHVVWTQTTYGSRCLGANGRVYEAKPG